MRHALRLPWQCVGLQHRPSQHLSTAIRTEIHASSPFWHTRSAPMLQEWPPRKDWYLQCAGGFIDEIAWPSVLVVYSFGVVVSWAIRRNQRSFELIGQKRK